MKCGGASEEKPADEGTINIVDQVRGELESKEDSQFDEYELVSYKTQVVAGTNYFAKVKVGDGKFVHLRIFQGLPHTGSKVELHSYKTGKTSQDALEYF